MTIRLVACARSSERTAVARTSRSRSPMGTWEIKMFSAAWADVTSQPNAAATPASCSAVSWKVTYRQRFPSSTPWMSQRSPKIVLPTPEGPVTRVESPCFAPPFSSMAGFGASLVHPAPGQGAAVDEIGGAGHETGIRRGEVAGELGDFVRGAVAADEVGGGHLRDARIRGSGGGGIPGHLGIDRPWAVTVHPYGRGQRDGHRPGELDDGGLGHPVDRVAVGDIAGHRRGVDDRRRTVRTAQVRRGEAGHQPDGFEVDVHQHDPQFFRPGGETAVFGEATL